jgi:hypothetical protein
VARGADLEAEEPARRDAHDCQRLAVDEQLLADDIGAAGEAPLPEVVTEHDQRVAAWRPIVVRAEDPAHRGGHPEHAEERAGHQLAVDTLAHAVATDVQLRRGAGEDAVEPRRFVPQVGEHRPRELGAVAHRAAVLLDVAGMELDERLRLPHRQRAQRHLIQQREDGAVGADPERDRDDGDEGKEGRAGEAAGGEAQVGQDGGHADPSGASPVPVTVRVRSS